MSNYTAHTETDEATGLTLKIELDDMGGTESPVSEDEAVIFAVLHRRYTNPVLEQRHAQALSFDFTSTEGIAHFENEMDEAGDKSEWIVFPLYMYDHSGTSYQCSEGGNPFSCRWDSGRVGVIALKRADVGTPGEVHKRDGYPDYVVPSYLEQAQQVCENYTAWANGEIYGYVVEDERGDTLDSCWGFIGDPDGYVRDEGRNMLAYHVKKTTEARSAALVEELTESRPDMYAPGENA